MCIWPILGSARKRQSLQGGRWWGPSVRDSRTERHQSTSLLHLHLLSDPIIPPSRRGRSSMSHHFPIPENHAYGYTAGHYNTSCAPRYRRWLTPSELVIHGLGVMRHQHMERSGLRGHRLASINGELRVLNFNESWLLLVITFNSMSLVIGYENKKSR